MVRYYGKDITGSRQSIASFLNVPPLGGGSCGGIQPERFGLPGMAFWDIKANVSSRCTIDVIFLGVSTKLEGSQVQERTLYNPVVVIKLILMPLFALFLVDHLAMANNIRPQQC